MSKPSCCVSAAHFIYSNDFPTAGQRAGQSEESNLLPVEGSIPPSSHRHHKLLHPDIVSVMQGRQDGWAFGGRCPPAEWAVPSPGLEVFFFLLLPQSCHLSIIPILISYSRTSCTSCICALCRSTLQQLIS